jgi:type 1 glutamine amidotransferase
MALIASLGAQQGFAVEATEDAGVFLQAGLPYRSVVFLNTTGDVLSDEQQQALEHYVRSGGGWVGVHAAADTEYDWPFYGELLAGAWFRSHPAIQSARLEVDVAGSFYPCCDHWEPAFVFEDEWYNFRLNPRLAAAVLLRLDESSYDPGPDAMGGDHPIAWQRGIDSGRAFYTGLGHRRETFADAGFRRHLGSAILWTGRLPPGDCDDDGAVDVAELLIGVDIALLRQPSAACRAAFDVNRDGAVTAEELVEAVAGPPDLAQRPAGALRAAG